MVIELLDKFYLVVKELDIPELKDLVDNRQSLHQPEPGRHHQKNVGLERKK